MTEHENKVFRRRVMLILGISILALAIWLIGGCALNCFTAEQAYQESLSQARLAAIDPRVDVRQASRVAFRAKARCTAWGQGRSYQWLTLVHDTLYDGGGFEVLTADGWGVWCGREQE